MKYSKKYVKAKRLIVEIERRLNYLERRVHRARQLKVT